MEFWGVEVKPGVPAKVSPEDDLLIHLSQAALGESKKDKNEPVMIFAKVGAQKFVLGTLSSDKFPQISFDVVFEKEFELSHTSKNVSVHFCGYQTQVPADDADEYPSDSEEDLPLVNAGNGKADAKVEIPKPAAASAKPKANVETAKEKKEEPKESDESGDEDDSDDDEEDGSSDSDGAEPMSDDDDDEDDDESEDEETPKKVESAKKRPVDSAITTPAQSKKQKTVTPQKTDGKKNVHTATPHPGKKPGAANGNKQSPKSGGQFSCKSCDRAFNSDNALQSHSKAKHDK